MSGRKPALERKDGTSPNWREREHGWVTALIRTKTCTGGGHVCFFSILRPWFLCSDPSSTWDNQAQERVQVSVYQPLNHTREGVLSKVTDCRVFSPLSEAVLPIVLRCHQPGSSGGASDQSEDWILAIQFQDRRVTGEWWLWSFLWVCQKAGMQKVTSPRLQ